MSLYVARNGQSEGPLTEAEVESRLRSGTLLPTDLAWREGLAEWTAIGGLLPKPVSPPPAAAPSPVPAPAAPAAAISLPKPPAGKIPPGIPTIQPRPAGVSFGAHAFPESISIPAPVPTPVAAPAPLASPVPAAVPEPAPAAPPPTVLDVLRGELRREQEKVTRLEREVAALREELRQIKEKPVAVHSPERIAALEERMRRAAALLSGNEAAPS